MKFNKDTEIHLAEAHMVALIDSRKSTKYFPVFFDTMDEGLAVRELNSESSKDSLTPDAEFITKEELGRRIEQLGHIASSPDTDD